jgi:cyclopropane fatty-acyl-phospholipid synthase-like methyltransferase
MDVRELYERCTREMFDTDELPMGPHTSYCYQKDPRHLVFTLSRYKLCAKLLEGRSAVLEVGCGDAFGAPIVASAVKRLVGIDWDRRQIEGNRRRLHWVDNLEFVHHDIIEQPLSDRYDAIFSIDMVEHIEPGTETVYMDHLVGGLGDHGVLVLGTPNITAHRHSQRAEVADQHVNLFDHHRLREMMERFFHNTFMFAMNDEVMHTGYLPMAHYLWALGVGPKRTV